MNRRRQPLPAGIDRKPNGTPSAFLAKISDIDAEKLDRPKLVRAECSECDGSGEGSEPGITCGTCDGSGRCSYVVDVCGSCGGEGERWRDSPFYCEECGGDHLEIVREDYEQPFAEALERVAS